MQPSCFRLLPCQQVIHEFATLYCLRSVVQHDAEGQNNEKISIVATNIKMGHFGYITAPLG